MALRAYIYKCTVMYMYKLQCWYCSRRVPFMHRWLHPDIQFLRKRLVLPLRVANRLPANTVCTWVYSHSAWIVAGCHRVKPSGHVPFKLSVHPGFNQEMLSTTYWRLFNYRYLLINILSYQLVCFVIAFVCYVIAFVVTSLFWGKFKSILAKCQCRTGGASSYMDKFTATIIYWQ
jgi:hypothetical protein